MKNVISNLQNLYKFLLFFVPFNYLCAQVYPPAQGPLPPNAPFQEIPNGILINLIKNKIQETVDTTNNNFKENKEDTGISAKMSFSLSLSKPSISVTRYKDQPNQNRVHYPFKVEYQLKNIKWHGYPILNRRITQNIDVYVACKDWFTNQGVVSMSAEIEKPYLGSSAYPITIISNYIDNKIRAELPPAIQAVFDLPLLEPFCDCLGINPGTKARKYKDGEFQYAKKNIIPNPPSTFFNTAEISLLSIKRLPARSGQQILYREVEDVQLIFYANQVQRVVQIAQIREGDELNLNVEKIILNKPQDNEVLVLIASAEQLLDDLKADSHFIVLDKQNNFGNGIQKIILKKSFFEQQQQLPGDGITQPYEVKVPAYELTVRVTINDPVVKN